MTDEDKRQRRLSQHFCLFILSLRTWEYYKIINRNQRSQDWEGGDDKLIIDLFVLRQ